MRLLVLTPTRFDSDYQRHRRIYERGEAGAIQRFRFENP